MSTTIYDAYGRQAIYETSQDNYGLRPFRPMSDRDIKDLMSYQRWRHMLSDSRWLATAFSDLAGAIRQKRDYVGKSSWTPQYVGDQANPAEVEGPLHDALKIIDPRGRPYTFQKCMAISCMALDTDGDFLIVKGRYKKTGWPFLQWIPAHRIGQRVMSDKVKGGRYDGATIRSGIVYNAKGGILAFSILGKTPKQDKFVHVNDVIFGVDPVWMDQGRGIPTIANSILDLYDIKTARDNEKIAQSVNSSIALVETNQTGTAPNALGGTTNSQNVNVETVLPGVKHYVKQGGSLEAFASSRPSDQWQRFDETIMRGALLGLGWRVEMLDLSKLTGAAVRGFSDNINTTILDRHQVLSDIGQRAIAYVASVLMEVGAIPEIPDFWKWSFQTPPKFTADVGRERAQDIEDARAGRKSIPQLIRSDGRDPLDVLRENAEWEQRKAAMAAAHNIDPAALGTLSKPGDNPKQSSGTGNSADSDES